MVTQSSPHCSIAITTTSDNYCGIIITALLNQAITSGKQLLTIQVADLLPNFVMLNTIETDSSHGTNTGCMSLLLVVSGCLHLQLVTPKTATAHQHQECIAVTTTDIEHHWQWQSVIAEWQHHHPIAITSVKHLHQAITSVKHLLASSWDSDIIMQVHQTQK